ncbi:MAG: SgcJ/EcaC family oxidoreductase [Sulfurimonas sp.]|nr:SgcJ/EcaC family oxidoreductase [Sulfurimonas sp.]
MTKKKILELFDTWNQALQTKNPSTVAKLYHPRLGILIPTVSAKIRHNRTEIKDYFVNFLQNNPFGEISESNIRIYGDLAINSGLYTFELDGEEEQSRIKVDARFTYVYKKEDKEWFIIEHHSSVLP